MDFALGVSYVQLVVYFRKKLLLVVDICEPIVIVGVAQIHFLVEQMCGHLSFVLHEESLAVSQICDVQSVADYECNESARALLWKEVPFVSSLLRQYMLFCLFKCLFY